MNGSTKHLKFIDNSKQKRQLLFSNKIEEKENKKKRVSNAYHSIVLEWNLFGSIQIFGVQPCVNFAKEIRYLLPFPIVQPTYLIRAKTRVNN